MKAVGLTTRFQFTQGQCLFYHQGQKRKSETILPFVHYFALVWKIDTTSLACECSCKHCPIIQKFAQIMANFSALGMRPHPLHPHAVRLC